MRQPPRSEVDPRDGPTLRILSGANLRQGPGVEFEVTGSARAGQYLEVIGRSSASDWYLVGDLDGQARWVSAGLVELQNAANDEIPIIRTAPGL